MQFGLITKYALAAVVAMPRACPHRVELAGAKYATMSAVLALR